MSVLPVILVAVLAAAIGPLTEDQRIRLETAYDGRDHRESAYIALVENAASWTGDVWEIAEKEAVAAADRRPDLNAMLADPDAHRGELCLIAGRIEQRTGLAAPYDGAEEWFIRDRAGRPILVYVVPSAESGLLREGEGLEIFARFYKRVDAEARDGQLHQYPAFVGASPRPLPTSVGSNDLRHLWVVFAAIAVMLVALLLIMLRLRRFDRSRPAAHRRDHRLDDPDEDCPPLPDDPVDALDELKRRAEADS